MDFANIHPFVRYVHYLPVDINSEYNETVPYDNRLFFTYHGSGAISANGKTYDMHEGSVIIIPSGVKYQLLNTSKGATYIAVNFDYTQDHSDKHKPIPPTVTSSYNPSMRLERIVFHDIPEFNNTIYIEGLSILNKSFLNLHKEYISKMIHAEHIISNLFSVILFQCARTLCTKDFNSSSDIVNTIIGYINEEYNKNLSNTEIGKKFNLHPNYVSSLIKIFTGMPLHQYITHIRISNSIEMLATQKYSIAEIAEQCGFCSIFHYSKMFKKIMGVSPSKY